MEAASTYAIVPFISGLCNVLIDRLLTTEMKEYLMGRDSTAAELSKLKTSLIVVDKVVNDAEWKQLTSPAVRRWLIQVKHAVYDAEDLLDEILTDAHQRKSLQSNSRQSGTVSEIISALSSMAVGLNPFLEDVGSKVQNLNLRFKAFDPMIKTLQLENFTGKFLPNSRQLSSEVVDVSQIFGRDLEKDEIVKVLEDGVRETDQQLMSTKGKGSSSTHNRIRIVAIVGMAGIGKTTLAQLIFNDPRVVALFQVRAWACVPGEEFDVIGTIKDLLISSSKSSEAYMENLGWLQKRLQHEVTGKKTLVVLDDVWDENLTADHFDELLVPLNFSAPGSTLILTTHNEHIARMLHPIYTLHLEELPDADCRHLFKMRAFGNPHKAEDEDEEAIITTLVAKCKGLPLAIRAIGDLSINATADELQTYASSNIWDLPMPKGILPPIYLAYLHLPPEVRKCFAYCSIFPKNYHFEKDKLVLLWMAEGFIVQGPHDDRRMEDVGNMHFNNLLARSFFQVSPTKSQFFVMHDLIHDLAIYLFRDLGFMLKSELFSDDPRHFSFMQIKYDTLGGFCLNDSRSKHLRTILPVGSYSIGQPYLSNELLQMLEHFGRLRVLSLCGYRITRIPPSIGNLKHLRYLDFSSTLIEELPETICELSNLQTLLLFHCQYLIKLPVMMKNLIQLRHLDIRGTLRLQEMPDHVGSLSCLQTLTDFVVGEDQAKNIAELGWLLELRGSLQIKLRSSVVDPTAALAAKLQDKKYLDEVVLQQSGSAFNRQHQLLLENLKPCTSLKKLTISDYVGDHFPTWLGHEAFHNLMVLNLDDCARCVQLPPLGQLPLLRDLLIKDFDRIETLGAEFYGEHRESSPFKSLVTLKFEGLRSWRIWSSYDGPFQPFPLLKELYMWRCYELEAEIPLNIPSLIVLDVQDCKNIRRSFSRSPNLRELRLVGIRELDLSNLANLNCLTDLTLGWETLRQENQSISQAHSALPFLESLENLTMEFMVEGVQRQWKIPPLIKAITITNCGNQEIDMEGCANIQCLKISGSGNSNVALPTRSLKMLNYVELSWVAQSVFQIPGRDEEDGLKSLYDLSIIHFQMQHYPELLLTAQNLTTLSLYGVGTRLRSLPTGMAAHYPCLQFLSIVECFRLTSITEDDILPAQLKTLEIKHCEQLASLPRRMDTCTSLQRLVVEDCVQLASLPENGLPPNLHELHFRHGGLESLNQDYEKWGLNKLTSLQKLTLCGFSKVEPFPAGGSLPTSLTVLSLIGFWELRSINCRELRSIPNLRELGIFYCQILRSFSEGQLPQSLCRLTIEKSPLAARCRKPHGHYADMASGITYLELDEVCDRGLFDEGVHLHFLPEDWGEIFSRVITDN